jgi:cytochrome c biogenesis protein ResB
VKAEAIHVVAEEGDSRADAWVGLRGRAELAVGKAPIGVEYRPDQRELPFTVKLMDFRKIDYPGISMAAGFESDVQVSDPKRGLILMRKISMNNPLRYRNFSLFQASYIPGEVETTVLSLRSDPGTPFVYAGFLIVIGGVVTMFVQHRKIKPKPRRSSKA